MSDSYIVKSRQSVKEFLDMVATIAMLIAAGVVVWVNVVHPRRAVASATKLQVPHDPVSLAGAEMKGRGDARVALVTYSDFQCPFCRRFVENTLPAIENEYVATGKILLAFRHLPLPIHPLAERAAAASRCAGTQGRFWEAHDFLFKGLDDTRLAAMPAAIGLDSQRFAACVDAPNTRQSIQSEKEDASALGISGTPSFFIGTLVKNDSLSVSAVISGAASMREFQRGLNDALRAAK